MLIRKAAVSRIVIAGLGVLGILIALLGTYLIIERNRIQRRLVNLLCETDYQLLLEACRDLSKRATTGHLKPGLYVVRSYQVRGDCLRPAVEVSQFPPAILDVDPLFVKVHDDGVVMVELFWAPSYGVVAYPEDYKLGPEGGGRRELIPGLWYYDEDYSHDRCPRRVKYIDALIDKGKMKNGVRRLVLRYCSIDGYSCLSFVLASAGKGVRF